MVDVEDVFLPVEGFKQRTGIRAQGDVLATDGFLQEPSTHAADHAQRVGLAFGEGCMAGEMGHQHGRCDRMPDVLRLSETIERQALGGGILKRQHANNAHDLIGTKPHQR